MKTKIGVWSMPVAVVAAAGTGALSVWQVGATGGNPAVGANPATASAAPGPRQLRLMTFNISAEKMDGDYLERQAKILNDYNPDLVALQAVDVKTDRVGGIDQLGELARHMGMQVVFGPTQPHPGGEIGNAILTRTAPLDTKTHMYGKVEGARTPRGMVMAKVQPRPDLPELWFASTHLSHENEAARISQGRSRSAPALAFETGRC